MEQSLELFDAHADEVFAHFLRQARTREEALALTEQFFLSQKTPYFKAYFRHGIRFMKLSS